MEYVVIGLLVFLLVYTSGHLSYWKGYHKGYNKAKEIYDGISSTEEFNEFMKRAGLRN